MPNEFPSVAELIRLIGRAIVGGSGEGARRLSRAERKAQGAAETLRASRELRAGAAVVGGLAILVVSLFVFQASGGGGMKPQPIVTLDVHDLAALQATMFGATPWILECAHKQGTPKLRSFLHEAAAEQLLPDGVRAGRLDCTAPMRADGPSLLQKFGLKLPDAPSSHPLLLAGHGLPTPTLLGKQSSATALARHLRRWSKPELTLLNSTLDLRRHCLSRPACFLLLTKGSAPYSAVGTVLKAIGTAHHQAGMTTVNKRTHDVSFTAQIPDTNRPVLIALRASSTGPLAVEARAFRGVVSSENQLDLDAFVSATSRGGDGFVKIETPPRIVPSGTVAGVELAEEELYDPLLSKKKYEAETTL
jgi:hypothetical protein